MGNDASASEITARLRGGLIVSCQAYEGEPMREAPAMAAMAVSVVLAGACAVRLQGIADLRTAREHLQAWGVPVPIIGLWKAGDSPVFITPTLEHALAVADAGADIVAIDGTTRPRPDGLSLEQTITAIKERTGALVMADCGSLDDAKAAADAGADYLGTTLAGYTGARPRTEGPDLDLVREVLAATSVPVIAEGRYETPSQVAQALELGVLAVCVGSAITHPGRITARFLSSLP